jgi:hypothetical protein
VSDRLKRPVDTDEAVRAWHALSDQSRAVAWAAAARRVAVPGADPGAVCVAYGRSMARRSAVRMLAAVAVLVLAVEAATTELLNTTPEQAIEVSTATPEPAVEPVEIRTRRSGFIVAFAVLVGIGVVTIVVNLIRDPLSPATPLALCPLALLAVALRFVTPCAFRPVMARFTPVGWELPHQRIAGTWAEVREIRIRPSRTIADTRFVVLMLTDPQVHLDRLSRTRRYIGRSGMREHGSPAVIAAGRATRIDLVALVERLRRYTSAPVTWEQQEPNGQA